MNTYTLNSVSCIRRVFKLVDLLIYADGIEKASNYKYPWPLKVIRVIRKSSVMLTALRSPGQLVEDPDPMAAGAATALLQEARHTTQIDGVYRA